MDEENKKREVVFENMDEFYSFIVDNSLQLLSDNVRQFYDGYSLINRGCGCSKKARLAKTENLYLSIPDALDDHRRYLLHRVLSEGQETAAGIIIFKHNGEQFNKIEFEVH